VHVTTSSALLHPVRLRIAQTLLGEGPLTTHQLHERLPDVPIATLYRHVNHLATLSVIEVADERRVRGTSEKSYRLVPGLENPSPDELRSLSEEELQTAFTVFTSGLIRDFGDYLQTDSPDLHADRVSFAQASFWASTDEIDEFGRALMTALEVLLANRSAPCRRRHTLTTVLMPRDDAGSTDRPRTRAEQHGPEGPR